MTHRFRLWNIGQRCKVAMRLSIVSLSLFLAATTGTALARDGADVFDEVCMKCHTPITQKSGWYDFVPADGSKELLAVVTPRGPTLNGIVGRPAGIISNYKYSKGMLKFSKTGAVWDRNSLDQFLTDSRKYVKGTFMIVKLAAEDRKLVLDYLESVAIYQP